MSFVQYEEAVTCEQGVPNEHVEDEQRVIVAWWKGVEQCWRGLGSQ